MRRIIFLLEEPSMKELLEVILPKILPPEIGFLTVPHEGKRDIELSIPRKLKGWKYPGDCFVILRDNDGSDCTKTKKKLIELCHKGGRSDTLVRIVCQELESWFLGDLKAIELGFAKPGLGKKQQAKKFRNPDSLGSPSKEIEKLLGSYGKISGARLIAPHLDLEPEINTSTSFNVFLKSIRRLSGIE